MGKYDTQINLLERLIHNWYDIKTKEDFYKVFPEYRNIGFASHTHKEGLCSVVSICYLEQEVRWEMFKSWKYCGYCAYPVDGSDEYYSMKLITDNPKRLHLAIWCLQWLRQRNIDEI